MPQTDAILGVNTTGYLQLWRPWTKKILFTGKLFNRSKIDWISRGESRALVETDHKFVLLDLSSGAKVWDMRSALPRGQGRVRTNVAAMSPDGTKLITIMPGTSDMSGMMLWDMDDAQTPLLARTTDLIENFERVSLLFSRDGHILLSHGDHGVYLWDGATLKLIVQIPQDAANPLATEFLDGGRLLAVGDASSTYLFDTATGMLQNEWPLASVKMVAAPLGDRLVVSAPYDAAVCIDSAGKEISRLPTALSEGGTSTFFQTDSDCCAWILSTTCRRSSIHRRAGRLALHRCGSCRACELRTHRSRG